MPARLLAVVVASLVLQLALATAPDTMGDLLKYRLWVHALAKDGFAEAYWPSQPLISNATRLDEPVDYPPLVPYLLMAVGWVGGLFSLSDARLDSLIRVPFVLANLALGLLLYADARPRAGAAAATLVASLYLLNPGVVFDTAYWGQADSLVALFLVGSLVAIRADRPEWGWATFALAVLTKPLAYPFGPLALLLTLKRFGWVRTVRCALAFLVSALVVLVPFIAIGRLGPLLGALFLQLDAMPYASVNAHNLWWLVERGTPWLDAREKVLGFVSYESIGLVLLAGFLVATVMQFWRSDDERGLRLGFASMALGFFILASHMHENHLFATIPLLLLVGVDPPRLRRFFVLISVVFFVNMVLHDPYLTHVARPWMAGPRLLLPQQRGLDPGFFDYFRANGYTHLVDQVRGETSLVGVVLTVLNAQLALLVFAWWLYSFYWRPSFDQALAEAERRIRWSRVLPAVALFVGSSGALFLSRAFREDALSRASPLTTGPRTSDPRSAADSSPPADRCNGRS